MTEARIKVGSHYTSKVWLNTDGTPTIMQITRITKSAIYYRPYYGLHDDGTDWLGSSAWIENTPQKIAKYLTIQHAKASNALQQRSTP